MDNGPFQYYSDNKYNLGIGNGDVTEVRRRRNWRLVDFWISDPFVLPFGPAVLTKQGIWARNEYIYIGRTTPGTLAVRAISMSGNDASHFTIGQINKATVEENEYIRIKISFKSLLETNFDDNLDAYIKVETSEGDRRIKIVPE